MAHYTYFDTTWKGRPVRFIAGGPDLEQEGRVEKLFKLFSDCGRLVIIRTIALENGGMLHSDGERDFAFDFVRNSDFNKLKKPQRGTI